MTATTIFTFPATLDAINSNIQDLLAQFADIINKLNASLANENQIINNQGIQIAELTSINTQFTVFNTSLNNTIQLMELIIQGLSGVATVANQIQQLGLLNNILQNQLPELLPRGIVLDLAHATKRKQVVPVAPGP